MEQPSFYLFYRDDRGRRRRVRVWADADRGYRGDFRAFADVGGGREALVPAGEHWATGDPVVAQQLTQHRVETLLARRQARRDGRVLEDPRLAEFIETHLARKEQRPRIAKSTVERDRLALTNLLVFSGGRAEIVDAKPRLTGEIRLSTIDVRYLCAYIRRRREDGRSEQTILNEVHAFSNLWTYAKAEGLVVGDNPVSAAKELERLEPSPSDATWLETGEAARLLNAAQALDADSAARFVPCLHAILAAFLLTGARKREVLGLERAEVDLDEGYVHFRPNRWRGLKSRHSRRSVPLWPQLRAILEAHVASLPAASVLLFPSHRHRAERPYSELDRALAAAVKRAEIEKPVTLHTLRHTYTAHRLYTVEGGAPVSVWDVAVELGHRDTGMIESVYGHVLRDRDRRGTRGDAVRYEVAKVLPFAAGNV